MPLFCLSLLYDDLSQEKDSISEFSNMLDAWNVCALQ